MNWDIDKLLAINYYNANDLPKVVDNLKRLSLKKHVPTP